MKNIIIRTLGGKGIGYGHFYRCLSLAKAIRLIAENIDIIFLINEELVGLAQSTNFNFIVSKDLNDDMKIVRDLDMDLFILDSYLGNNEYLNKIKEKTKLMLIDDNNDIYDSSIPDAIYNGNIHAKNLGYPNIGGQLQLLGSEYLIMKEEYWEKNQDKDIHKRGILITTGGTDEYGITLEILKVIKNLDIEIKVIIGPGFNDSYIKKIEYISNKDIKLIYKPTSLKEYIKSSRLVITAGGSTVYEVLSQGVIPIIFSIANNQDLICKELGAMGVEYLGKYPDIDYGKIVGVIQTFKDGKINFAEEEINLVNSNGAILVARMLLSET